MTAKMLLVLTVSILAGLFLPCAYAANSTCDDIQSQSCALFMKERPGLCSDPCLAKLCPRLCGKCPLKCYGCKFVDTPEMCNNTIICPDQDHYCIDSQTFTNDFRLEYNLGCAHRDVCKQVFGNGQSNGPIGKRQILSKGECCQSDLCNHHVPGVGTATTSIPQSVSVLVPPVVDNSSSSCSDLSSMGCQLMAADNKAICNDPCIASICPRTCGKCAECYSCNQVNNIDDCNSTTTCLTGEECYVVETLNTEGGHGYRMGCMHEDACTRFHTQAGQIFGKRGDTFQISFKGDCCKGDLCNHKELGPATSSCPYGGVGHHCPTGYFLIDGKCYHIGDKEMTYTESQAYCKSKCGALAEHLSSKDTGAVLYYISYLYHKSSVRNLYVGVVDKNHDGHYTWDTTGGAVFHDTTNHGNYCATISSGFHGRYSETNCNSHHQPLCQAERK